MKILKSIYLLPTLAFIAVVGFFAVNIVNAEVTATKGTPLVEWQHYKFFATSSTDVARSTTTDAVSTTISSFFDSNGRKVTGYAVIAGAQKATFYFGRTVHGIGKSEFSLEVSPDGTDWYDFNRLIVEDGSDTATTTYTITSTSTDVVSMDLDNHTFNFVRCVVDVTTDGTNTCEVSIEY